MHAIQRLNVIPTWPVHLLISSRKIDRIRSEIAVGWSAIESTTISEAVQCFSCETKLQSFKSLTNNEVFKLIKSGTIKSCSLDPLPASIMAKCCYALLPMLTRIINLSLATGEMPEDLYHASTIVEEAYC